MVDEPKRKKRCETCGGWVRLAGRFDDELRIGECRRRAPLPRDAYGVSPLGAGRWAEGRHDPDRRSPLSQVDWSVTTDNDWCLDWAPIERIEYEEE